MEVLHTTKVIAISTFLATKRGPKTAIATWLGPWTEKLRLKVLRTKYFDPQNFPTKKFPK